jgi:hypothetical protein
VCGCECESESERECDPRNIAGTSSRRLIVEATVRRDVSFEKG